MKKATTKTKSLAGTLILGTSANIIIIIIIMYKAVIKVMLVFAQIMTQFLRGSRLFLKVFYQLILSGIYDNNQTRLYPGLENAILFYLILAFHRVFFCQVDFLSL